MQNQPDQVYPRRHQTASSKPISVVGQPNAPPPPLFRQQAKAFATSSPMATDENPLVTVIETLLQD